MARVLVALLALAWSGAAGAQTECPVKLGAVLPVSGPMGQVGERIAETGQFAVEIFNEAGGVKGCEVQFLLRDTQGQPAVGVDAAKSLIDIEGVPALIGAISSGVSLPILTSVAVPSKVTQVSCCSSSPSFSELAKSGQTEGYWFRTYATNRTQAAMGALIASDQSYERTAVIYVNTDFGVTIAEQFKKDLEKLGGTVTAMVTYNESQPSYRAEVSAALEGDQNVEIRYYPLEEVDALIAKLSN
jgi:ABC-type branched-subunit amino acid transport system substrate-binding protein